MNRKRPPARTAVRASRQQQPRTLAAVDLGSNSFHMVIARLVDGQLDVVDRLREPVRLGSGLDARGNLCEAAKRRALATLARFGQRLGQSPAGSVRAVGTHTLRRAPNARAFLRRARTALGHPIEVIPGSEEARLVYLGVAHDLYQSSGRRLVIDIGGGSTECIVGEGFQALESDSLSMGCVTLSEKHFRGGAIDGRRFDAAILAARLELEPLERRYRALGWSVAVGASGTILAVEGLLRALGRTDRGITAGGLAALRERVLVAGHVDKLSLPGMQPNRAAVLPGGIAILCATFEAFRLEVLTTSQWALREGLLHDLVGRIGHEDTRDRTVNGFAQRYRADPEQAARVERTAHACLQQVATAWALTDEPAARLLSWAARLHEVGLTVSHAGYHKHGAYLVANSDMAGFSRDDQLVLAGLIRCHRRRIHQEDLPAPPAPLNARATLRMCVLLRLAILLNRIRSDEPLPAFSLSVTKAALQLRFPQGWLGAHPLTRGDLEQESVWLREAGIRLVVR